MSDLGLHCVSMFHKKDARLICVNCTNKVWNKKKIAGASLLKGDVLLRCEIYQFLNVIFAIIFTTMNGHTFKLFKNILNDVQTKGEWEINKA